MELKDKKLTKAMKQGYPRTPEHFRKVVESAVRESQNKKAAQKSHVQQMPIQNTDRSITRRTGHRRPDRRLLIAVPAAALIMLGCGTALAAGNLKLGAWLKGLGANQQKAEEYVETDPDIIYSNDAAPGQVIDIQEYYFDGNKLVLVAKAADGSGSTYYSKDHARINDTDCMVNSYVNPDDPAEMIYEIDIPAEGLPDMDGESGLILNMRFYVGDAVQECIIELHNVDTTAETNRIPDQTIPLKNGSVDISELTVSLSGISARLHFSFEGDDAEEQLKKYTFCYELSDSNGNKADCLSNTSGIMTSISEPVNENGIYSSNLSFTVTSLDSSSDYIILTPYIPDLDGEGKAIPDTGERLTDEAITISLKPDTLQ